MKKILTGIAFICCLQSLSAQSNAYAKGSKILNAGVSFGYFGYGYFGTRSGLNIPLNASLEYGFTDVISAGPYLGYARWSYQYNDGFGETKYAWTFVSAGAKGSFHYTNLLNDLIDADLDEEKIDLYFSLLLGLEFRSYKDNSGYDYYANNTVVQFGPNAGVRYLFNKNLGVYVEGGRGNFGWLNLGITAKF